MTDRINEIRERVEKASPGPWRFIKDGNCGHQVEAPIPQMMCVEFVTKEGYQPIFNLGYAPWIQFPPKIWDEIQTNNQTFIAHAREDIPFLLSELDRLTKIKGFVPLDQFEAKSQQARHYRAAMEQACHERDRGEQQNKELREALRDTVSELERVRNVAQICPKGELMNPQYVVQEITASLTRINALLKEGGK